MTVLAATDDLPFLGSIEFLMPPAHRVWLHQVPRTTLELVYDFAEATVTFISVRRQKTPVTLQ